LFRNEVRLFKLTLRFAGSRLGIVYARNKKPNYTPMKTVQFELNGNQVTVDVQEGESLMWVIREQLGLTGTKFGCGEGYCGSCTVIMDGSAVRSCAMSAAQAAGSSVLTVEGLSRNGKLHHAGTVPRA
jgi:aerobic-type carbon monoxide dehydrogenase small subunit (CoxS/CutS family)